jgi:1-acyl-sn-glycerol-3-phosphate acyltransferase
MVGEVASARPLLLISNHISYLDVFILGTKTPALFTPKSEIASWLIIGGICRLLDSVFIERKAGKTKDTSIKIKEVLQAGEVISIFAEGTTGNGKHLLPFKSSLFSIAEEKIGGKEVWVQPAIIRYTHIAALPIDSGQLPKIAWYGDMVLAPHLWELLQLGKIDVTITLLPPVTCTQIGNRKQLATYCEEAALEVLGNC